MRNKLIRKVVTLALAAVMVLSSGAAVFGASGISADKAVDKALKNAGTTRSAVWGLEYEREGSAYEIEFVKGSKEYSYEISAINGFIREKTVEYRYVYSSKSRISKRAAKDKALKFAGVKASSVKYINCFYDYDDGKEIYEVKFRKGNFVYECEVNARSGKMVEYSREYKKAY